MRENFEGDDGSFGHESLVNASEGRLCGKAHRIFLVGCDGPSNERTGAGEKTSMKQKSERFC